MLVRLVAVAKKRKRSFGLDKSGLHFFNFLAAVIGLKVACTSLNIYSSDWSKVACTSLNFYSSDWSKSGLHFFKFLQQWLI